MRFVEAPMASISQLTWTLMLQNNTLSMSHMDLCSPSSITPPIDDDLVEYLQIRHEPASDSWMHCLSCALVDGLLGYILKDGYFPRLKTVLVHFDQNWTDVPEARKRLERNGLDLVFTHVGRCRISGLSSNLDVRFEHTSLAAAWEYVAALPTSDGISDGAGMYNEPPPLLREGLRHPRFDLPSVMVSDICTLFHAYSGRHKKAIERFPGPFRRIKSGIRHEWMEPENQDARVSEFITISLERAGRSRYEVEWD